MPEKPDDKNKCWESYDQVHQFFEIKKLHKRFGDDKLRHKDGVLVKCALCNQSKELWE